MHSFENNLFLGMSMHLALNMNLIRMNTLNSFDRVSGPMFSHMKRV